MKVQLHGACLYLGLVPLCSIALLARFSLFYRTRLAPLCCRQAFAFGKGNDIALEYLKELRQNGTDRRTEMSTLISGGFLEYQAIKEAEEAEVTTVESGALNYRRDRSSPPITFSAWKHDLGVSPPK